MNHQVATADFTHSEMRAKSVSDDSSESSKKRLREDDDDLSDGERQRLRDKNRTNSKRFRDRKKNFMDGLFEEKYRLGKDNNDLRETNQKLHRMLQEAEAENELLRRCQAAASLAQGTVQSLDPAALMGFSDPSLALLRASQVDDFVPRVPALVPNYAGLMGDVARLRRNKLLGELALKDSLSANRMMTGEYGMRLPATFFM